MNPPFNGRPGGLTKEALVRTEEYLLERVECRCGPAGWSEPEPSTRFAIVFVRGGCFHRRLNGVESFVDPTVVYFERPEDEQQISHPAGGDSCSVLYLSAGLLASLSGGEPVLPKAPVATDAATDLSHRALFSAVDREEDTGEAAVSLAANVLARTAPDRVESGRPATAAERRRIVGEVREALVEEPGTKVLDLARRVFVSPHHLSRVFKAETGETISCYRNRLRVRLAVDRIAEGEACLARLAADLGFADQAHLARAIRAELDTTASGLRMRLGAGVIR